MYQVCVALSLKTKDCSLPNISAIKIQKILESMNLEGLFLHIKKLVLLLEQLAGTVCYRP